MPRPAAPHDGESALMRVSEFQRRLGGRAAPRESEAGATRLSSLNPSLMEDLLRFERTHPPGQGLDLLEVLAAALRHRRALLVHLQIDYRVLPLAVLAAERVVRSPLPLRHWIELRLPDLRVLRVAPAPPPPGSDPGFGDPEPMAPLLWELALRGSRGDLLPEIAGVAAYRVVPGANLSALTLAGSLAAAVTRLREQSTGLHEIAGWPGFDRDRAARMLNGLYLQGALMISRSHAGAVEGGSAEG